MSNPLDTLRNTQNDRDLMYGQRTITDFFVDQNGNINSGVFFPYAYGGGN
jgi:hypothetical protein